MLALQQRPRRLAPRARIASQVRATPPSLPLSRDMWPVRSPMHNQGLIPVLCALVGAHAHLLTIALASARSRCSFSFCVARLPVVKGVASPLLSFAPPSNEYLVRRVCCLLFSSVPAISRVTIAGCHSDVVRGSPEVFHFSNAKNRGAFNSCVSSCAAGLLAVPGPAAGGRVRGPFLLCRPTMYYVYYVVV